jgi:hypothetical protein
MWCGVALRGVAWHDMWHGQQCPRERSVFEHHGTRACSHLDLATTLSLSPERISIHIHYHDIGNGYQKATLGRAPLVEPLFIRGHHWPTCAANFDHALVALVTWPSNSLTWLCIHRSPLDQFFVGHLWPALTLINEVRCGRQALTDR